MDYNKAISGSIAQWRRLHDDGYFQKHASTFNYPTSRFMSEFFKKFVKPQQTDDVLEIGCGYGALMYAVAKEVNSITGLDIHRYPVMLANSLVLKDTGNAQVFEYNGKDIPYNDDTFHVVYSCNLMQHLPKDLVHRLITEACRVLKPCGRLYVQFIDREKFKTHDKVIDVTVNREQTTAWTQEEILLLVNDIDMHFTVSEYGRRNLCLTGRPNDK